MSDAKYPYTPDGDRSFIEDKPFLEPFSIIPAMGAVTTRIRFVVSVLKLTVRHPVLVAKQAASTAVLTNDRLTLGIGTSPWPEDYEVCDVPFERRGKRADESMDIIRGLLTGDWFEHHGEIYDIPRIKQCPVPGRPHADPRRGPRRAGPAPGGGAGRRLDPRRRGPRCPAGPHRPALRAALRGRKGGRARSRCT